MGYEDFFSDVSEANGSPKAPMQLCARSHDRARSPVACPASAGYAPIPVSIAARKRDGAAADHDPARWNSTSASFELLARLLRTTLHRDVSIISLADYVSLEDEVHFDDLTTVMQAAWKRHKLPTCTGGVDAIVHSTWRFGDLRTRTPLS